MTTPDALTVLRELETTLSTMVGVATPWGGGRMYSDGLRNAAAEVRKVIARLEREQAEVRKAMKDRMTRERDAWKALAEVRAKIIHAYQTGSTPTEATFRKLDAARLELQAMGIQP